MLGFTYKVLAIALCDTGLSPLGCSLSYGDDWESGGRNCQISRRVAKLHHLGSDPPPRHLLN